MEPANKNVFRKLNSEQMQNPPIFLVEEQGEPITSFRIRVSNDLAEFSELWPRTDRWGSALCYIFQCADYLQVWCDTIGKARGTQVLFVGVFDSLDQPILFLPLGIERHRGVRVLRFLDGGVCDYNAPIVVEPKRTWQDNAVGRLWSDLIRVLPRFDIAMFDKMPVDIAGVPNPLAGLAGIQLAGSVRITRITGSWDQYVAKKLPYRRKSGQQRRKLAKVGPVTFRIAETSSDRRRIVQVMMRQKSRRCAETGQFDELSLPGYRQYYMTMTERFAWPGQLLVTALEVNGDIVSTSWSLIFNRRFLWMVTTFEGGEWKRFSPGRILLEELLEWSFSHGITIFDFGVGDEGYKGGYSDQELSLCRTHIPVTMLGKAYRAGRDTKAWRLLRPLAKRAISITLRRESTQDVPA